MRKTATIFIMTVIMANLTIFATHQRGGHIVYEHVSGLTFKVTIYMWMYMGSNVPPQRTKIPIWWGDGTSDSLPRVAVITDPSTATILQIYEGVHTYPGHFVYTLHTEDPNRDSGVVNIPNSINLPIYLESSLAIYDPVIMGYNNSPVMLDPGVVTAVVGQPFIFVPVAYDPDGDSLAFELEVPKTTGGINIPGYQFPDDVNPANDVFSINPQTGVVSWITPQEPGHYNFAIRIYEYRNGVLIGSVLRDVRVIVYDSDNRIPLITTVKDTCIWAGDTFRAVLYAYDPDSDPIGITVTGDVFTRADSPPVATIVKPKPDSAIITIEWTTRCDDIDKNPYTFIVTVRDSPLAGGFLKAVSIWRIKVIAPPDTVYSSVSGTGIILDWGPGYRCSGFTNLAGFSIWRKVGPGGDPAPCLTDPSQLGYTLLYEPEPSFTYVDNTVSPGNIYCYRIVPVSIFQTGPWIDTLRGAISNETCDSIPFVLPVILNASVRNTSITDGSVYVRWMRPLDMDTNVYPPPYKVEVYRGLGFNPTSWTLIRTGIYSQFSDIQDTMLIDSPLNTAANPWSYHIRFYYQGDSLLGSTPSASTPYLILTPGDKQITLQWNAIVPWTNFSYVIWRKDPDSPNFRIIDTVDVKYYTDTGLINNQAYCYVISPAIGMYTLLPETLHNNSQIACATPRDNTPPCPPTFSLTNPCERINENYADTTVSLTLIVDPTCAGDASMAILKYRPDIFSDWINIDTISPAISGVYTIRASNVLAGCYGMTLIDSSGNESPLSDTICFDPCPIYQLPSAFSPNGDGIEDTYTPIPPVRYVEKVDFKVYNRWGTLVFSTEDPLIKWDGRDMRGNEVPEGTYYYLCYIYVKTFTGVRKSDKPLSGFIELRR